jgi:hypothetical protein
MTAMTPGADRFAPADLEPYPEPEVIDLDTSPIERPPTDRR